MDYLASVISLWTLLTNCEFSVFPSIDAIWSMLMKKKKF